MQLLSTKTNTLKVACIVCIRISFSLLNFTCNKVTNLVLIELAGLLLLYNLHHEQVLN